MERSRAFRAILTGGLIAGVLDITAAIVTTLLRGGRPAQMLQSIASGVLGDVSYQGGPKTAALGLMLHFVIALGATAVFFGASRWLGFLVRQAIISGLLYGVVVYFFMNLVVLPLSRVPFKVTFRPSGLIIGLIVHMLCVGLPIALVVRRYSNEVSTVTR
ncbi:MAG: hypothetical protein ACREBG_16210 [Pyrinomonadaceae bacterium]